MADIKFRETVQVGADKVTIEVDGTFAEFAAALTQMREIGDRVTGDSYIRQRPVGDEVFNEMYSPSLNASKNLSEVRKPALKQFPFFIHRETPWIRVVKEDGENQWYAMYDSDFAAKAGKVRLARAWYPVERISQANGPAILKAIGPAVEENVKYKLGYGRQSSVQESE